MTDLAATPGTKIKMIDHSDVVAKMNAKYDNLYSTAVIKAGTYPGQDKDNQVSAVWNILVTNDKMSDEDAYNIVKLIIDKKADLVAVHKDAQSFTVENQVVGQFADPVAPGSSEVLQGTGRQDVTTRYSHGCRSGPASAGPFVSARRRVRVAHAGNATGEIAECTETGDAETHGPIGVEGHRQSKPRFGKREHRRHEHSAPESGGYPLCCGGRTDHQREYQ